MKEEERERNARKWFVQMKLRRMGKLYVIISNPWSEEKQYYFHYRYHRRGVYVKDEHDSTKSNFSTAGGHYDQSLAAEPKVLSNVRIDQRLFHERSVFPRWGQAPFVISSAIFSARASIQKNGSQR